MIDVIIAFGIGIIVGVALIVLAAVFWPKPLKEHEEEFLRSGAPPDPNPDLVHQLKRCRHALERLLNDPTSMKPHDLLRTINQTKRTIRKHNEQRR